MQASEAQRRVIVIADNSSIRDDLRNALNRSDRDRLDAVERLFLGEAPAPRTTSSALATVADRAASRLVREAHRELPDFEVDAAVSGDAAVSVRQASELDRPYAVAFVDIRMPSGWDGVEAIQRLWAADPGLQVVVCSARSDFSSMEMVERLGRDHRLLVLKKPFDDSEAAQLAAALAEKRRLFDIVQQRQAADGKQRRVEIND